MPDSFGEVAQTILWPAGSDVSNQWSIQTNIFGHTAAGALSTTHSGTSNYYVYSNTDTEKCHVNLEDFTDVIDTHRVDTIQKISVHMFADNVTRADTAVLQCDLVNGATAGQIYTEDISISTTGQATEYEWTERTTRNGSDAWTIADMDNIQLRFIMDDNGSGDTRVYWIYLLVHYTQKAPTFSTYTSGNDVVIPKGSVKIPNGISKIKKS